MFKFFVFLTISAVTLASPIHYEEPEHHAEAQYEFGYTVHDKHTGDIKSQHETRHGDNVEGEYSLVEPDGHKRTVHYKADKKNGFTAVVHREGTSHQIHHDDSHHNLIQTTSHQAAPQVHHLIHNDNLQHQHHVAPIFLAQPHNGQHEITGHSTVYQNAHHQHNDHHH